MANIQLKRGQKTTVDVTYILSGQTNAFNFTSQTYYTAKLYIRRKTGDSYGGILVDTLTTTGQATDHNSIDNGYPAGKSASANSASILTNEVDDLLEVGR